jgi:hypothetical protein
MKLYQQESLSSKQQIFFYDFSHKQQNNNSWKFIIFKTQMGKAWHIILKT